ncbi:hypothetical protein A2625_02710 [candidate division WOR-1 bacterium RIFCSPHIGHO2_01_FULL_53_15]|uniref:Uncharacterized protein n=1 Tax=candidate division WOR-1 bacterium RIFCSPHIGHO2_01_FULL_53_15 TaxID=1802564 RepID=A0A1F4Q2N2_UNCSA|nr:MAG: hypothetical protein A2625_02710 [candidate division WOR-1 bacterium RIFCSPHIGHO2_01_FULL_53_15]
MAEPSATKRIAKNFSWLFVGSVIGGLLNFAANVYVARVLGAASFGLLNFAQAFMAYLVLLVDSGLSAFGMREVARERKKAGEISLNILAIRLLVACLIYVISLLALYLLPISAELRWLFIITFLYIFYRALSPEWIFHGLEKMEYMSISKVIYFAATIVLFVWLVRSPGDLVNVPLLQFIAGMAVTAFFLIVLFRKLITFAPGKLDPSCWSSYFIRALPLGASMVMMQIYNNLDTIMLGFMDKAEVIGHYSAAYKIFYAFVGVFSTWQAPAIPISAKHANEDRSKARHFLEKYLRLTLLAVLPLTVLMIIIAPTVISLFFGTEYLAASLALQILMASFIVLVISITYGNLILISAERSWEYLRIVALGAAVNVIMNLILIPRFSLNGAAAATLLTEFIICLLVLYYSNKVFYVGVVQKIIRPAIALIPSLGLYAFLYYVAAALPHYFRLSFAGGAFLALYSILIIWWERGFLADFIQEIISPR